MIVVSKEIFVFVYYRVIARRRALVIVQFIFLQNIVILGVLFVIFETVSGTNHTGRLTVN